MNESPIDLTDAKVYYLVTDSSGTLLWRKEATVQGEEASIPSVPKKYQKYGMRWQYELHTQDGSIRLLQYGSYPKIVERKEVI